MKAIDLIRKIDSDGLLQNVNNGSAICDIKDLDVDILRCFGDCNILVAPIPGVYLAIYFNLKDNLMLGPADALLYRDEGKESVDYLEGVALYRID